VSLAHTWPFIATLGGGFHTLQAGPFLRTEDDELTAILQKCKVDIIDLSMTPLPISFPRDYVCHCTPDDVASLLQYPTVCFDALSTDEREQLLLFLMKVFIIVLTL